MVGMSAAGSSPASAQKKMKKAAVRKWHGGVLRQYLSDSPVVALPVVPPAQGSGGVPTTGSPPPRSARSGIPTPTSGAAGSQPEVAVDVGRSASSEDVLPPPPKKTRTEGPGDVGADSGVLAVPVPAVLAGAGLSQPPGAPVKGESSWHLNLAVKII